jgi:DNA-directed RNA polymerase subunit RPC12/RpoP
MAVKPSIKCNCGQRIVEKDVMQTGYYLRLFGPSFVYVKFRCSRCKKLGEQFVKQDQWEDGMLKDTHAEIEQNEKESFRMMGPISVNEQIDFHFNLETTEALSSLKEMMAVEIVETAEVETRE